MNPEETLDDALVAHTNSYRAAILQEDDATTPPQPPITIEERLWANQRAAAARKARLKNTLPAKQPGTCRETGCSNPALPDQPYCNVHTLVGKVPELGDESKPKAAEYGTHPCTRCNARILNSRFTSICDDCSNPKADLCPMCKRKGRNTPAIPGSGYCAQCREKITPEARLRDKCKHMPQCSVCGKHPALDPENGGDRCIHCTHHGPTTVKKQTSLEFPDESMYGWLGDFANTLGCPLSAAYPAVLAVAAGYGVPFDPRVRTTLYVTILGKSRAGKSVTKDRALQSWAPPSEIQVVKAYPGSEIGLVQILGGKKLKDMASEDYIAKPMLLVQDEMRLTFGKIAIQNSALPNALNEMFYENNFQTAAKQGRWACSAKLSILGCLTCANPDEFADIYGVETATGLYGRTIFGIVPSGWDFNFAEWVQPTEADGSAMRRYPKTCKVTAEAFRMAIEWARESPAERNDLRELALRVALITASLNHDDLVTEECMRRALMFMEWQQRIRAKYRPSEMDTPSGKCQQAIVRSLEHYEDWVPWRDLCRNHSLYKNKAWDATILNRVKRAMIFEGMLEEELGEENNEGKREKTGRVRLLK